jgi:hypothetical protein
MEELKMVFYDKPIYLTCVVYLPAFKGFQEDVIKYLVENHAAAELKSPLSYAVEVAKTMSTSGYPRYSKLPLVVSTEEGMVLLSKCLKLFNNSAAVRTNPIPARVNREVNKEKDFIRIVNDLLLQQDNISLSQIWNTAIIPKIVWTSVETPLNGRLSRTVIDTVAQATGEKKKPTLDQVISELNASIQDAIVYAAKQENESYTNGKYQLS